MNNNSYKHLNYRKQFEVNEASWNLITPTHQTSKFYDLSNFVKNQNSLHSIETRELGAVNGKKILHLQSHLGNDSISLVAKGAEVTAVDFCLEAIQTGKQLSGQTGKKVNFIHSNVYDIEFESEFDVVFLSYGALCWIPDLKRYFELIYKALKKGGEFYFVDFHSNLLCFDTLTNERKYNFTETFEPIYERRKGSYAESGNDLEYGVYYWIHSSSKIIQKLLECSFTVDEVKEFDYLPFDCFPGLIQDKDQWKFGGTLQGLPLLISVKSKK